MQYDLEPFTWANQILNCYQLITMIQCPAQPPAPRTALALAAPELQELPRCSSSLRNHVSFQLWLSLARAWEAFRVSVGRLAQLHLLPAWLAGRHPATTESRVKSEPSGDVQGDRLLARGDPAGELQG